MSAGAAVWMQAARPRTLPAAVVPVVVGTAAVASLAGHPHWPGFAACLAGALAIQIGCNFANDAFDHLKGADTAARLGPRRAVSAGLISARAMLGAAAMTLAAAFAIGLYLAWLAGWPILAVGLAAIACAVLYTGGPAPLAYLGLGDLFVFIFFGLVAVLGSVDVQVMAQSRGLPSAPSAWAVAISLVHNEFLDALACGVGLQCATILVVNNLRDLDTDAKAGKRTLAVRFGPRLTRWYYAALHLGATLGFLRVAQEPRLAAKHHLLWMAPAAAALGGLVLSVMVARAHGKQLNPLLARSAMLELLTGALLVIGLSI